MNEVRQDGQIVDQIIKALQGVVDPELGIDLVILGLIYGIDMTIDGTVTVTMTLTTMGCPITDVLRQMIETAIRKVNGVCRVRVDVVWEPAWTPARMSRLAKITLGYHG